MPFRQLVSALVFLVVIAPAAAGQGIVVGPDYRMAPLHLAEHAVDAQIDEQVAVVTVRHTFHNASGGVVEGRFLFPLPADAQVSRFSMEIDGKEHAGALLDAEEARAIYEEIVRKSLDPALLEMVDHRTFQASVFPIPAGAARTITLRYDATLPRDGETVLFSYPFQGSLGTRWAGLPPMPRPLPHREDPRRPAPSPARPPATVTHVRLDVRGKSDIANVYSPSHPLDVERPGSRHAVITYRHEGERDGRDLIVYYRLDNAAVGASLLSHRPYSDRPGYFLLMAAPNAERTRAQIQPRDIVFVLDTSGSMAGDKIDQAREALRYCVQRLGDGDRFGIVAFSSDVDPFRETLMPASARNDALFFIDQLEARGGTNIDGALQTALGLLDDSRQGMVVFLTDGLPSTGETDEGAIRKHVATSNDARVSIFPFGVGYDVNTRLLDGLAGESGAFADYISPEENIEERVGGFYDKIRYPVMTDLQLAVEGIDAYAMSPGDLPNLYMNGQLIVAGRYRRAGAATVRLTGTLDGRRQTFTYTFDAPATERERDFVARLWAQRRVGTLLDVIRMKGENEELKEEIVALAKEFGIVTPYTSYLVTEDEAMAETRGGVPNRPRPVRRRDAAFAPSADALSRTTGREAVQMSKSIRAMQDADVAAPAADAGMVAIDGRTMVRDADGAWTDDAFRPGDDEAVAVAFGSDTYFRLLKRYPEALPFARLGNRVTFRLGDRYVAVGDAGQAYDDAALTRLFGAPSRP